MKHDGNHLPPVDLEWRIETRRTGEALRLEHTLRFPSGHADLPGFESPTQPLHPNDMRLVEAHCFQVLESTLRKLSDKGEPLLPAEVMDAVRKVGEYVTDRLLPQNVQEVFTRHVQRIRSVLLLSDETGIPWELVRVGPDKEDFLCLRASVGRWIEKSHGPNPPPPPGFAAVRHVAGLIADDVDSFRKLPAAGREAAFLEGLIERHEPRLQGKVKRDASSMDLLRLLRENPPDCLHFVGHGDFRSENPDLAGLFFTDRQITTLDLGSQALAEVARRRPFVFLNACRAGQVASALTGVGGWPDRWLRFGRASALICPQWAVKDSTAHAFTRSFYTHLENPGTTLGEAVLETRRSLLAKQGDTPEDPTPLAYAFYGHPHAVLHLGPETDQPPAEAPQRLTGVSRPTEDVLRIPQLTWKADRSPPGALLRAEYGVVDFHLREQELDELKEWCLDPSEIGVRLMTGPGGFGKTRLAKELCLRMRERGWQAGFVGEHSGADEVWASMTSDERPSMAVVDYAESRSELLIPLLAKLWAVDKGTYRVVLLARAALDWWEELKTGTDGVGQLVGGPATRRTFVRPLATSEEMRTTSYRLALDCFCRRLELTPPETGDPDLRSEIYEPVLMIHMRSLAAAHGVDSMDELGILDYALDRERRYWRRILEARGLPRSLEPGVETGLCLLTLADGVESEAEAIDLLGRLSAFAGRPGDILLQVAHLLHDAYPGHGPTAGRWIEPLMPDLLGEHLALRVLGPQIDDSLHEIFRILMHGDPSEEDVDPANEET